ncbi:MAG: isocitrate/isopropylmalate family dehydrogenase [Actinomyces sp.]|nr:isocitrate/isopropylmalate family dehydrogenase [Actinomyces sp.]
MTKHIAILRGDGIGPEIVAETVRVLDKLIEQGLDVSYEYAPLGGEAYDEYGHPYPEFTQNLCRKADAVLLGAVGSPQYDNLDRPLRPERGLLAIRKDLNLFANLRPAILYKELANASTLKPEIVAGLDILIGGIAGNETVAKSPTGIVKNLKSGGGKDLVPITQQNAVSSLLQSAKGHRFTQRGFGLGNNEAQVGQAQGGTGRKG